MPVGRKAFISDRSAYFRDYYIKHKHEYIERYKNKKNKQLVETNYYVEYYSNWTNNSFISKEGI